MTTKTEKHRDEPVASAWRVREKAKALCLDRMTMCKREGFVHGELAAEFLLNAISAIEVDATPPEKHRQATPGPNSVICEACEGTGGKYHPCEDCGTYGVVPAPEKHRHTAEVEALRKALGEIAGKAGSHTVSNEEVKRGVRDHGYAGIYAVAVAALATQPTPTTASRPDLGLTAALAARDGDESAAPTTTTAEKP